ncbi:DUF2865 domain-containing protein [Rhodobium gokarnense]|uniref:DUF2865 domain-containing protein n=1 Tax=Rhodobium gokarnense TaxID=364296 RepID=A0ABT3HGE0_9HYPH|nr:DUF2865 domain-containing protein [Rhodobium gokarnense]MCW2309463.1 hypothetical protein [Rhodobium gokarnense]
MSIDRPLAFLLAGVVAATALGALSSEAAAQRASCARLEAQLARAEAAGARGQSRKFDKWNRAVGKQRQALKRARSQARRGRCTGSLFGQPQAGCNALMVKIDRMEANLAKLERGRDRHASGGGGRKTARIRAKMRRIGCGRAATREARAGDDGRLRVSSSEPRRRGLLGLLFGGQRNERSSARVRAVRLEDERSGRWQAGTDRVTDRWTFEDENADGESFGQRRYLPGFYGNYRTLCVRTCDGYYFPISFRTTQEKFARDQAVCAAMCPSADVRLYVHRNPGEESEDMISVDGEPYTELPTAFAYRDSFKPECTCGQITSTLKKIPVHGDGTGLREITLSGESFQGPDESIFRESLPAVKTARVPDPKLPQDTDPDTIFNLEGGFTDVLAQRAEELKAGKADEAEAAPVKRVRQVGTSFFADQ